MNVDDMDYLILILKKFVLFAEKHLKQFIQNTVLKTEKCSAIARNKNISENNKQYYNLHRSSIIEKSKNNRKRKK